MPNSNADRNLLIGILSLQLDFIDRDQMVKVMNEWVIDKSQSLDQILLSNDLIDTTSRDLIIGLVDRHLEVNNGDAERSLAAIGGLDKSLRDQLSDIDDKEVDQSLSVVPGKPAGSAETEVGEVTRSFGYLANEDEVRYQFLRPHARGGLGEVSVALDTELNREVALKQIQERYAYEDESRARFLLEAEITGGLEHPGIVPVYGLGAYEDGRPFYAMRFVRGDSLKEAADEFHASHVKSDARRYVGIEFRKLVGRFVDVCNAIEYAHSRGVLHRDLKPGNIMLGKYGETLVVDWGLSKVVGREDIASTADEMTLRPASSSGSTETRLGMAIGTPQYMSPEQAEGRHAAVGPCSDVFSLGATLYYMLTGQPPYKAKDSSEILAYVRRGNYIPVLESQPLTPKPLAAICDRAMSLDAADRYRTSKEMAEDIERWLADEPVSAYSDPFVLRLKRWMRTHQTAVVGAAAAGIVGIAATLVIVGVVANSNRELNDTNQALNTANNRLADSNRELSAANDQILQEQERVRTERDTAHAINEFVSNDLLGQASPDEEADREISLRAVLDRAAQSISDQFSDRPLVDASISSTIGYTYLRMGYFQKARPLLVRSQNLREKELGPEHPDSLHSKNQLCELFRSVGDLDSAESTSLESIAMGERIFGVDHPLTLAARLNLAGVYRSQSRLKESEAIYRELLEVAPEVLGPEDRQTLLMISELGMLYQIQGRYDEAEPLQRQALETRSRVLGEEHPDTLVSRHRLGSVHRSQLRFAEAHELLSQTLDARRRVLGNRHPRTLVSMSELAEVYRLMSRLEESEALHRESLELRKEVFGPQASRTLASQSRLAFVYFAQERMEEAESLMLETLALCNEHLPEDHSQTMSCMNDLALLYRAQKRFDEAIELLQGVSSVREAKLGDDHPTTMSSKGALAMLYMDTEQYEIASELYERALDTRRLKWGSEHPSTQSTIYGLAIAYERSGRQKLAIPLYEEYLGHLLQDSAAREFQLFHTRESLGTCLMEAGRFEEALVHFEAIIEFHNDQPGAARVVAPLFDCYVNLGMNESASAMIVEMANMSRQKLTPGSPQLAGVLLEYALKATELEAWPLVEMLSQESLTARMDSRPRSWQAYSSASVLGLALLRQTRYDDAKPHLLFASEGMLKRQDSIPVNAEVSLTPTVLSLIDLFDQAGEPELARQWRHRLIEMRVRTGLIELPQQEVRPPRP